MKILITNNGLSLRAGTELYVRDLALALQQRGHSPFIYSPTLGDVAEELRAATLPVIDNLDSLSIRPDVIHGHHHLETMMALLRFPGVPAVYFCHGWIPWEEAPPRFPRILRYVAVSDACRDRLLYEHGIPEDRIHVILNFVNLERFKPRGPLPPRPQRALVFSNYASETTYVGIIRKACAQAGIMLEVIGSGVNRPCVQPELVLGGYDLVFAKGRAALEALAVGAAVILCDQGKIGPMVTSVNLPKLRPLNLGLRTLREPISTTALIREIARYDPADAVRVSQRIREVAGQDAIVDQILALYEEILKESSGFTEPDGRGEWQAAAQYLRFLSPRLKAYYDLQAETRALQRKVGQIRFITRPYHYLSRLPVIGACLKAFKRRLLPQGDECRES